MARHRVGYLLLKYTVKTRKKHEYDLKRNKALTSCYFSWPFLTRSLILREKENPEGFKKR